MSARGHVDVNERRLRPIYDCLDNGNNKKAIQEADKVLRKQKDVQCANTAKVLKGLAMLRMGRHDDSAVLLEEVHVQHPTDEATLQAMAICYREMHKLELIADMYENAYKQKQDNEEFLSSLFMSYVRLGDYKKQQQTAMALHRLRPKKNPYYFWAIMSIVMQAHNSDAKLAQTMYLPLAERMTQKYVADDKIQAEAEVQMYLIILELMGRHEEALKVVQGHLGAQVMSEPNYQQWKSAELLSTMEKWPQINAIYRKLLLQEPDHWNYYQQYFTSLFALVDSGWNPDQDNTVEGIVDSSISAAVDFIDSQVKGAAEAEHCPRGPYLAQMELLRRLKERKSEDCAKIAHASELLQEYFMRFGSKLCCFSDMKGYLELLGAEEKTMFIGKLLDSLELRKEDGCIGFAHDTKTMQRHQCVIQLARYCGHHHSLNAEGKMQLVQDLVNRYKHGLSFGEGLLATDLQYSDNYLVMAAHILVNLHQESGNNKCLWQAISLLERGLSKSPSNFQFKVVLIRLYATLGAFSPASALYEKMEIKHIQHDALGYVISNHATRLGDFASACSIYDNMLKFFHVNHRDISDCLISSYKFGSFTKIHEFVKFRERLQNSLQHATAKTEKQIIELTRKPNSPSATVESLQSLELDPSKDSIAFDKLYDNRDLNILLTWDPPDKTFSEELKQLSFKEEVAWLQVRHLTLRLLSCAVQVGQQVGSHTADHMRNGDASHSQAELLPDLIDRLKRHIQDSQDWTNPKQYPLCGPFRTRLSQYLSLRTSSVFLETAEVTAYLSSLLENPSDQMNEKMEEKMKCSIPTLLEEIVVKHTSCLVTGDAFRKVLEPDVVEHLVLIAETIAQMTVLLGVCHQLVKPLKTSATKKSKKKKGAPVSMPISVTNFRSLVEGVESATKSLHSAIQTIDVKFLSSEMGNLRLFDEAAEMPERDEDMEKEVTVKVRQSYQATAKELQDYLDSKLHYLAALKH